jgi:hypothetical protein
MHLNLKYSVKRLIAHLVFIRPLVPGLNPRSPATSRGGGGGGEFQFLLVLRFRDLGTKNKEDKHKLCVITFFHV